MPTLNLIKTPYEISFTGNPMQFIWQVAPYGSKEQSSDITVTVRVLVENIFNSGIFDEVYVQKLYPAGDGTVRFDVGSVISPYLDYYTPRTDLARPIECISQRKRYQVTTTFDAPGLFPPEWYDLPVIYEPPVYYYAMKGGLAKEAWHYKEFFTKIVQENKMPLLFSAAKELTDPEALKFIYWIYPNDDNAAQTLTYTIYCSDGTTVTKTNTNLLTSGKWSVNCAPAGFNQSGLDALVPLNKSAVKYSIKVTTAGGSVVDEYFFNLDNRNFYDKYFLLYRNSIGGLDTVRLLGEVDLAAAYDRQQARRTLPPDWFNSAEITDEATEETFSYTADTGFMSKEQLLKLRDLFLSREKYCLQPSTSNLQPIAITSNKVKFYSNKDNLVSTSIEWQTCFINSFFTPGALMPQTRTCPAVETFIASQLNKNTLQFLWSLEDPYQDIEVQTTINATTIISTFHGNTGMSEQAFDNPITDNTSINITIKVRTICNPDSVPVEYGPFSTYIIAIHGDSLPVAVDDYFQVPLGFTGLVEGSVLDNDYDPDGDPIEAVVNWGLFGNGSSPSVFQIDSDGKITISNVPVDLVGKQSFDYQIHNPGSDQYVTGHVFITFGNGPQAVYVKWVMRNVKSTSNSKWAEAWLDYYSDPACTIPVDITALGLTINAKEETMRYGGVIYSENYSFIGSGTKKLMWSGNIFVLGLTVTTAKFTVLNGTGYIPVNP